LRGEPPHHSNVFPEDREGILQVIEYRKTRIPKTKIDLVHIHGSSKNSTPANAEDKSQPPKITKVPRRAWESNTIHLEIRLSLDNPDDQ